MKYKGKKLTGRHTDVLVLMRGTERIVIKAEALENYEEFDSLVSEPLAPEVIKPGGSRTRNVNDPTYKKAIDGYAQLKTDYLIIKSLLATPEIEWEIADITKPDTWKKWKDELTEAGFSEIEKTRIIQLVSRVNSLDDDMLEQVRQDFLLEESQQEG